MNDARFQQTAHGFLKLTAIRSEVGVWRRCVSGEAPHAIVSRVMGIDTFAIVTNGELDGLDGITLGSTYGVGVNGELTAGLTPIVARVVRSTAILVDLSVSSVSESSDVSGLAVSIRNMQASLEGIVDSVDELSDDLDAKADKIITITGQYSITGGGDLSSNQQVRLVNDAANPGANMVYGTGADGLKGWKSRFIGPQPVFERHSAGYNVQIQRDFNGIAARSCLGI